jgi:hypothetical protein
MLKRLFAYALTLIIIASYGAISGAEHVKQYRLNQYHVLEGTGQ